MFLYSWVLCFVVDVLSIVLHIDAIVGALIQPSVERIVYSSLVWNLVVYVQKGAYFII